MSVCACGGGGSTNRVSISAPHTTANFANALSLACECVTEPMRLERLVFFFNFFPSALSNTICHKSYHKANTHTCMLGQTLAPISFLVREKENKTKMHADMSVLCLSILQHYTYSYSFITLIPSSACTSVRLVMMPMMMMLMMGAHVNFQYAKINVIKSKIHNREQGRRVASCVCHCPVSALHQAKHIRLTVMTRTNRFRLRLPALPGTHSISQDFGYWKFRPIKIVLEVIRTSMLFVKMNDELMIDSNVDDEVGPVAERDGDC